MDIHHLIDHNFFMMLRTTTVKKGLFQFLDKEGKPKDVDNFMKAKLVKACCNGRAKNTLMNGFVQVYEIKFLYGK